VKYSLAHTSALITVCLGPIPMHSQVRATSTSNEQAIERRANQLLSQMSVEEKIGQLCQLFYIPPMFNIPGLSPEQPVDESIAQGKLGSLVYVGDVATSNHLQHIAVEKSPHHIPLLFGHDVIHGFRTIFPVPLAMAASWDMELVTHSQSIAAVEARSTGVNWTFSPMVDIARDPRWGRIVEGAGEDPYLGAAVAAAQVRGFQGDFIGAPDHLLATAKHFAGYGAAEGGRDYDAAYIPDVQLHNVYLPPFQAAVRAGVGSVMSAYLDVNDVPATGNRWLLHDVLHGEFGFHGVVVSDADAVKKLATHGFAKDEQDAAVRALHAGVNVEMATGHDAFLTGLLSAVQQGRVTKSDLNDAVRPILEVKFRLGLFDHPYVDKAASEQILADPGHRVAARMAAEKSAVLLRNEGGLLPLKKDSFHHIAIIGPLADSKADIAGPEAMAQNLTEPITVLEGLRAEFGATATISYVPGAQLSRTFPSQEDIIMNRDQEPTWSAEQSQQEVDKAMALARVSDLVVMTLGEAQNMSGESASQDSLELPGGQEKLLEAVASTGKKIVLVLINGRPLNIVWASQHIPAILEVWYPGTEGGTAIANLLVGDAIPGGKLPLTWPRDVGQVPIGYAHNTTHQPENQGKRYWDEVSTPLFPFGFGLSYSTFHFTNLRLDKNTVALGNSLNVAVDVSNSGSVKADEVVQLYTHQRYGSASRPVRELKGFRRITLSPGQTETVHFVLRKEELTYWSGSLHSWVNDPSMFDVWVGGDSEAELHTEFSVTR
jgi:beta-glucosidase